MCTLRLAGDVRDPFPLAVDEEELEADAELDHLSVPFRIKSIRRAPSDAEGPDRKRARIERDSEEK